MIKKYLIILFISLIGIGLFTIPVVSQTYMKPSKVAISNNGINDVGISTVSSNYALKVDVIQTVSTPISGTVTADQGIANTQTNRWPVFLSDGTNERGTLTNALRIDPTGTTTQPVSGNLGRTWTLASGTDSVSAVQSGTWNIGTLTSITNTVTVDSELTTSDLDTGVGTDTRSVIGLVLAASGGGVLVGSANPMPIFDNNTTLSIDDGAGSITVDNTGTFAVQASQSGTWILGANSGVDIGDVTINNASGVSAVNIQDGGNSLTIDNSTLSVVGGGLEATSLRVTIASDSTGVLSIDDNGSTISIDDGAGSITVDGTVNVVKDTSGSAFYAVKRTDITTASVNIAFGFTSKKVVIETSQSNTDEICVSYTGGTAVCPAVNTAGNDRIGSGRTITLDDYAVASISVISASGTQTIFVRAWN